MRKTVLEGLQCLNGHKQVVKLLFHHSDSKTIDLNAKGIHGKTQFIQTCINEQKGYKNDTFTWNFQTLYCTLKLVF